MNEQDVCLQLSNWFKQYGCTVLQDKKNECGNSLFHVKGDQHKPDLIVMNGQNTAIEVKIGDNTNTLGVNSGVLDYFNNYCEGKTTYFDDKDRPIKIDNFVLATRNSIYGHLKDKEPIHEGGEHHKYAANKGYLPEKEYEGSFNIVRTGIWQQIDKERYCNCGVGIGILLSSILGYQITHYNWRNKNILFDNPIPAIVVEIPNPKILTKNGDHRWGFEWKPL